MIELGKPLAIVSFSFASLLGGNAVNATAASHSPSSEVAAMVRELCDGKQKCHVSETNKGSALNVYGNESVGGDKVEYFGNSSTSTNAEKIRKFGFQLSLMVSKTDNDPLYSFSYYSNGVNSSVTANYLDKKQTKGDTFTMDDLTVGNQTTLTTGYNYMTVSSRPNSPEGVSGIGGIVEQTDPRLATKALRSIESLSDLLVGDIHDGRHLPSLGQVIHLAETN